MNWNGWGIPLLLLAIGVLGLLVVITYFWCMVNAAKNGKWVWFVLMLFFQVLFIFYLLFADKRSSSPVARRAYARREPHF